MNFSIISSKSFFYIFYNFLQKGIFLLKFLSEFYNIDAVFLYFFENLFFFFFNNVHFSKVFAELKKQFQIFS